MSDEPATTRVLIAEDQGMMRSALATLLDLEDDLQVVATVARGDEVVTMAERMRPDVILLDIELPGRSGLEVLGELAHMHPESIVIIVTTFARPGYLRRALAAGARGFLVKDDPVERLAASIRRALAGEIVVDPLLATQALSASPNPLSEREQEVLGSSGEGRTIADIAGALQLSTSTVRNYLSSAIGKTASRNRSEALSKARNAGWL
ncbi:MAG TPA: response regulator transcription factor [Leifsonia sp.]|nr:response regulator transcription factor [Leifsonia sp.]